MVARPAIHPRAIHPRKLAAIDIAFLGAPFVIAEFAAAVVFGPLLGFLTLRGQRSLWQLALGLYLICLGVNYVPMLWYAIDIARKGSARAELGDELADQRGAMRKYRGQSVFLLVPLWVPATAITWRRAN